jgi:galactokinase
MDAPGAPGPQARVRAALGDGPDVRYVRAPGRVNLIGDHTDYQDGFCLPAAIQLEAVAGWRAAGGPIVALRALDAAGEVVLPAAGPVAVDRAAPAWQRTVAAAIEVLGGRGRPPAGLSGAVASSVPIGSGLSSSAAFEIAVALALAGAAGWPLSGRDLVACGQEIEQRATGVPCGILDQMAAVFGRAGHALLVDCRAVTAEPVALPGGAAFAAVHCGLPRTLAGSEYAARRAACEAAAARLGVPALRDASPEQVAGDPVARHVVSENARVLRFAEDARRGDVDAMGRAMVASHRSLRDDFRVSTPELDLLVDCLLDAGALGARLTGAGFGGCVVALADPGLLATAVERALHAYRAATGLPARWWPVVPSDGAGPLGLPDPSR